MAKAAIVKYQMSAFKRSPFADLLKIANADDLDLDTPPEQFEVIRFGKYKAVDQNSSFVEYQSRTSKTRLRINR